MKLLYTMQDNLEKISISVAGMATFLIMILTAYDVMMRKFFNSGIPSLYEVIEEYLMVALVFLSVSYVHKMGGHVRVELFETMIPVRLRPVVRKLSDVAALVFFGLILAYGWLSAVESFKINELSMSALAYPLAPAKFLVTFGAFLTCLRILKSLFTKSESSEGKAELSAD